MRKAQLISITLASARGGDGSCSQRHASSFGDILVSIGITKEAVREIDKEKLWWVRGTHETGSSFRLPD